MGKSVFIPNSLSPKEITKRLRNEIEGYGLKLEGPLSDMNGAIEKIAKKARDMMKSGACRTHEDAVLEALAPRGFPNPGPCLDVPFVVVESGLEDFKNETAGAVASSEPVEFGGRKVRKVDIEELTLVGLSLLRRLAIEGFYSYIHYGSESLKYPCIFVPGEEHQLLILSPSTELHYPMPAFSVILEVLDDDSLLSMTKLKLAAAYAKTLMKDVAKDDPKYKDEWELRARIIGHLLYQGLNAWDIKEARISVETVGMMFNFRIGNLESMREIAERDYVRPLTYPNSYILKAASTILCEDAHELFFGSVEKHFDGKSVDVMELIRKIREIEDHPCTYKLEAYLCLAAMMSKHIHHMRECEETKMRG